MHAGRTRCERNVRTIVDEDGNAERRDERPRHRHDVSGRGLLQTHLHTRHPGGLRGASQRHQIPAGQQHVVSHEHQAKCLH